jgi:hypothetical protein
LFPAIITGIHIWICIHLYLNIIQLLYLNPLTFQIPIFIMIIYINARITIV